MLGGLNNNSPSFVGDAVGAGAGVVGKANGSLNVFNAECPGVSPRGPGSPHRCRRGGRPRVGRVEGVAVLFPPGVQVLEVDFLFGKCGTPVVLEECSHFMAIASGDFTSMFGQQ
eukprot:6827964-Heterocapsa_arctica.AAC.1